MKTEDLGRTRNKNYTLKLQRANIKIGSYPNIFYYVVSSVAELNNLQNVPEGSFANIHTPSTIAPISPEYDKWDTVSMRGRDILVTRDTVQIKFNRECNFRSFGYGSYIFAGFNERQDPVNIINDRGIFYYGSPDERLILIYDMSTNEWNLEGLLIVENLKFKMIKELGSDWNFASITPDIYTCWYGDPAINSYYKYESGAWTEIVKEKIPTTLAELEEDPLHQTVTLDLKDLINKIPTITNDITGKKYQNLGEIFNDYTYNQATQPYSHSEGQNNKAWGNSSHAEGRNTMANGQQSHAEGRNTIARGIYSHSEGQYTEARNTGEHAEGNYNISNIIFDDDSGRTLSSIGMGKFNTPRMNAVEVMQNGDMYITGVGGYDGTNPIEARTIQTVINDKSDPVIVSKQSETSKHLQPNTFYKWDTITALNIGLDEPTQTNLYNEYMFEFKSGTTPTKLTLPETVKWINEPDIEANKTYQVSIVNNMAVIGGA